MTDLQTSLFIIGGAFLVGVISYNKWQEYKAKKSVERAFSGSHDDVLMTPGKAPVNDNGEAPARHEPKLFEPELDTGEMSALPHDDMEQSAEQQAIEPQLGNPVAAPAAAPAARKDLPVDELIDCAIPLVLEAPVRGDKALPALQTLRHVGNKPIHFIGERQRRMGSGGAWRHLHHLAGRCAVGQSHQPAE